LQILSQHCVNVFLEVNTSLRWLNNVVGVYLVKFSFLLLVSMVWAFLQVAAPRWLDDFANFTPTPEQNYQYIANNS
jgi:hypothetical protein